LDSKQKRVTPRLCSVIEHVPPYLPEEGVAQAENFPFWGVAKPLPDPFRGKLD